MTDPFLHFDGAYVLGALDDADRQAFEAHLATCPDCRARVDEVRPTVGLLAGLSLSAFDDPGPVPDTLLPGLLRRASHERNRRRWLTASIGAVAAACVAALVIVVWPASNNTAKLPAAQAFSAVRPSPVSATARLVSHGWGTEIDLNCRYTDKVERYVPYELVVVDKSGDPHPAGTWTLTPAHTIKFTGGTDVPLAQIDKVEIALTNGGPAILKLDV
jgi:Putative zinc-finger